MRRSLAWPLALTRLVMTTRAPGLNELLRLGGKVRHVLENRTQTYVGLSVSKRQTTHSKSGRNTWATTVDSAEKFSSRIGSAKSAPDGIKANTSSTFCSGTAYPRSSASRSAAARASSVSETVKRAIKPSTQT